MRRERQAAGKLEKRGREWSHLYSFVVDQRVYGDGCGFVVRGVGGFSELGPPGGGQDRERGVCNHGGCGDDGELGAVLVRLRVSVMVQMRLWPENSEVAYEDAAH